MMIVSESDIKELIKSRYGFSIRDIFRLNGYEDVNIHFSTSDDDSDNTNYGHSGYILKLSTSASESQLDLQHKLMKYLSDNGIPTCTPVKSIEEGTICKTNMQFTDHQDEQVYMCVLTYLPGQTMHDAGNPLCVFENVGKLAGKVDSLLKKFDEDVSFNSIDTLWELSKFPGIEELLFEYCDENVQTLGQELIKAYQKHIEPILDNLQKGLIHGDLNDCNIIMKSTVDTVGKTTYDVSGVIDYGDVCYSYYIYEIASLIGDLMSSKRSPESCPLNVAKLVLHGYRLEFELQQDELDCLRMTICIRLLQYYVLSAVSLRQNPENEYAGMCRDEYLVVCKYLWNMDELKFRDSVIV